MAKRSMFVGMDVHKESIDISLAEERRDGEVRHYGAIARDVEAVAKWSARCGLRIVGCDLCMRPALWICASICDGTTFVTKARVGCSRTRRHPDHSADARTLEYSADATLLEREDEELRRGLEVSWNNKGRPLQKLVAGACNQRYLQLWSGAA
jgi:hypothetical protein